MSVETKTALDNAIAAHVADESEDGAIVTGYVLHASYLNPELDGRDATGYYAEFAENQAYHSGYGLAMQLVDHYRDIWGGDDDDE